MRWLSSFSKRIKNHQGGRSSIRRLCPMLEDLESRVVLYSATGNAWPAPQLITISFVPDGTNLGGKASNLFSSFNSRFGSASTWENIILQAAQSWAQQTNINFAVIPDNGAAMGSGSYQQGDPGFGDIRIGGYNFNSTALGQATLPPPVNNYSIAGDIAFNTGQGFNVGTTYDLQTVATHELGHALGLLHSGIASADMYSAYNGVKTTLSSDDIAGIQSIYGGARKPDKYDGGSGDGSFATAYNINSMINTSTLTGLVTGADITTTGDKDYYVLNVPSGTNGTMKVTMQSKGLSLLRPQVYIYNASGAQIGSVIGAAYGDTITTTYSGVTAGSTYYLVTGSPLSTANGTGAYALSLTFGNNAAPSVPLPNTQTLNGNPLSSGGGVAIQYNSETLVNGFTQGSQTQSANNGHTLAMDANGNFVIVWQSQNQDGSGWGVYAQRFDASGNKVGSEFRVNSTTADDQANPSVAMSPGGNFVVVWASHNQDGSGWGVYAQQYSNLGAAVGGEFQVNTYTKNDQNYPDIAMLPGGGFVVTWASNGQDGSGWGVYAQQYSASGSTVGGEFHVNSTTADDQTYPSVSADSTGNFVIVWQSHNQDGSGWGVYAQRYNSSGVPVGGEFRVNTTTTGDQAETKVAMDASGDFTVVWASNIQDGDGWGIYAQRYNSQGAAAGGETQVNTVASGNQQYPNVATDSAGDILFTWSSNSSATSNVWTVFGRQFNVSGTALGAEFQINTSGGYGQLYASVAMDNQGEIAVDWSGGGKLDNAGIYMQQYTLSFLGLDVAAGDTFNPHERPTKSELRHQTYQHHKAPAPTHVTVGHGKKDPAIHHVKTPVAVKHHAGQGEKHTDLRWNGAAALERFPAHHLAHGATVKTHVVKAGHSHHDPDQGG